MNEPNALRLAKWLDAMPSSGYALTNQASAELRRLHEVNQELLEALKQFASCELNEENCASLEVATRRIRSVARAAIAKGEQA